MKSALALILTIILWFENAHAQIRQLKAVGIQLEVPGGYQVKKTQEYKDKSCLTLMKPPGGNHEIIFVAALGLADMTKAHAYNEAGKAFRNGDLQPKVNDWDVYRTITKSEAKPDARSYSAVREFGMIGVIVILSTDASIDEKVSAGIVKELQTAVRETAAGADRLDFPAEKKIQGSPSMEPTIQRGDAVEVDSDAYKATKPGRWDMIVSESPITSLGTGVAQALGLLRLGSPDPGHGLARGCVHSAKLRKDRVVAGRLVRVLCDANLCGLQRGLACLVRSGLVRSLG